MLANKQEAYGRKLELMRLFNSKCTICGYNKNSAALCFHHIDESTKSFQITLRECSNNKIETLLNEAAKCTLLCANCHMELHHSEYTM